MTAQKHKGGRPKSAPSAIAAWNRFRPSPGTGELAKLAKTLGVPQSSLNIWPRVPENRLDAVAAALGVPPSELRPDLFPPWAGL